MNRKKTEKPAGAPAWMSTFSDMMTLLLCFFVLLYSMSTLDTQKWRSLVEAFSRNPSIFESIDGAGDDAAGAVSGQQDADEETIEAASEWAVLGEKVRSGIADVAESLGLDDIPVEVTASEIVINLPGDILFDTAQDVLKQDARSLITMVMDAAVEPNIGRLKEIRFEGHTDVRPIGTFRFPSNKELSAARAIAAANFVEEHYPGIPRDKIGYIGYAATRPVDPAGTPEAYAKNRRVAIVMIRDLEDELDGADAQP